MCIFIVFWESYARLFDHHGQQPGKTKKKTSKIVVAEGGSFHRPFHPLPLILHVPTILYSLRKL
jgi:hypothetical protein